jgi:hypothetical protein
MQIGTRSAKLHSWRADEAGETAAYPTIRVKSNADEKSCRSSTEAEFSTPKLVQKPGKFIRQPSDGLILCVLCSAGLPSYFAADRPQTFS